MKLRLELFDTKRTGHPGRWGWRLFPTGRRDPMFVADGAERTRALARMRAALVRRALTQMLGTSAAQRGAVARRITQPKGAGR